MKFGIRKFAVRCGAVAFCCLAIASVPMLAQSGGGGQRGGMMSPEAQKAQLDAMVKAVGLTDDQVAKIKAINADSMKKMMALRESGGDPQDMRPKMMEIRQSQQTQIQALLTDEQKPKYEEFMKAQRPMGGGRGPGGDGPPPPPPSQL